MPEEAEINNPKVAPRKIKWLKIALIVIAALVVVVFGSYETGRRLGWWGDSDILRTLKSDPLADPNLLGLKLAKSKVSKAPGFKGKSSPSYLIHWFEPEDPDHPEKTVEKLTEYAEREGWQRKTDTISDGWYAIKPRSSERGLDVVIQADSAENTYSGDKSTYGLIRISLGTY